MGHDISDTIKSANGEAVLPVTIKPVVTDRLTCRFSLIHTRIGRNPAQVEGAVHRNLDNSEQASIRDYEVDSQDGWITVDFGWVKHPGMLSIVNLTGKLYAVQPTAEELEDLAARVVLVRFSANDSEAPFKIRPRGWPFIAELNGVQSIQLRCLSGVADLTIATFPH